MQTLPLVETVGILKIMDTMTPMWVYIVECCDGTFYTGVTRNLSKRVYAHNHRIGAEYTKERIPVKLVYSEEFPSHAPAYRREKEIKLLSHEQKKTIVDTALTRRNEPS